MSVQLVSFKAVILRTEQSLEYIEICRYLGHIYLAAVFGERRGWRVANTKTDKSSYISYLFFVNM